MQYAAYRSPMLSSPRDVHQRCMMHAVCSTMRSVMLRTSIKYLAAAAAAAAAAVACIFYVTGKTRN